ncbi:hypothetical protein QBC32DRAFT_400401 [Pseudoneurospora amorphoporcata]|uniref:Methyltransferase domain-containing protein n=1 Tax=Pseudoneurospora amorphoporcata TaxID=241081 RepID=A0AAN6SDQ1_9PEZI|nr:hypothetical protein QBC32DRAFT_400401 [Pseudoneurospora amorphoporcata]
MAIHDMATEEAKITTILSCFPHDPSLESLVYIPRFRQRLSILSQWSITPGSRVLDIGCGQGDSSLALALELGPTCHVTGIDTAPPDYGTPINISQSQEKILQSSLGNRLAFHNEVDAATFFKRLQGGSSNKGARFDAATACHSLFYFPSHASVASLFHELAAAGIKKVYVAEYDHKHTLPSSFAMMTAQTPHVLAAKAQALYYAYKAEADVFKEKKQQQQDHVSAKTGHEELPLNIRAAPDVESITRAAAEAGYKVARQGKFTPAEDYLEGHFETRYVRGERFEARVRETGLDKEKEDEILGVVGEVRRAYEVMEGNKVDKVRCMDVWWGEFEI